MSSNINASPLLSIVIPTKNRVQYMIHSIQSILSINDPELELIISDNSESDTLQAWVTSQIVDSRLHYQYIPEQISMTDNFNSAMSNASGYYVCTLGDDDSVNPAIMDATRWAKSKGIDALSSKSNSGLVYFWPDFISRTRGDGLSGKLFIEKCAGGIERIDVETELSKCLSLAGQGSLGLPRVYHGIIKRECLLEVLSATGSYFKGVSPDVYGAIIVSKYLKNPCTIDYPLTISGNSGGSNAGRAARGTHKGRLRDDPHIKPFRNLIWPIGVPEFYSVQTVWASATIDALNSSGRTDLLSTYNYALLHAMCIAHHSDYIKSTLKSYNKILITQNKNLLYGYLCLTRELINVGFRFGFRILVKILPSIFSNKPIRAEHAHLKNINEASLCVLKNLKTIGITYFFKNDTIHNNIGH